MQFSLAAIEFAALILGAAAAPHKQKCHHDVPVTTTDVHYAQPATTYDAGSYGTPCTKSASVVVTPTSVTSAAPGATETSAPIEIVNKIKLLHTNDIHARFEQFNKYGTDCAEKDIAGNMCFGGAARLKTKLDEIRSNNSDVVLLDAGDQFQGTMYFNTFGGSISTEMMNLFEYTAMSSGNHEFDKGIKYFSEWIKKANFPVLNSNIDLSTAGPLKDSGIKPYVILPKYKLGIIGYITKDLPSIILEGKDLKVDAPEHPVQKLVDELHAQGITRIICVSHNGYEEDKFLAENTSGINLIVGGHSHSYLGEDLSYLKGLGTYPTEVTNKGKKPTYVVQAHRFGNFLGNLDIEWDEKDNLIKLAGQPILLDQTVAQDPTVLARVLKFRESFAAVIESEIGTATDSFASETCKDGQCAMGNLVSDCIFSRAKALGVDGAFVNAGGIRAALDAGPITVGEILTVLPFQNTVSTFDLTGEELLTIFARAAVGGDKADTTKLVSVPLFAGNVKYSYDAATKAVVSSSIDGAPVDPKKTYKFASTNFVATGGDRIMPARPFVEGNNDADEVIACIKEAKTVSPVFDDRVVVV